MTNGLSELFGQDDRTELEKVRDMIMEEIRDIKKRLDKIELQIK